MTTHADTRTVRCIRAIQLDNLGGQRGPELVDRRQRATMPSGPLGARMQRAPNYDAVSGARRRRPWWAERPSVPSRAASGARCSHSGGRLRAYALSASRLNTIDSARTLAERIDCTSRSCARHAADSVASTFILGTGEGKATLGAWV